jgi:pimeloyl-ACP methyl ester carboxylesterase
MILGSLIAAPACSAPASEDQSSSGDALRREDLPITFASPVTTGVFAQAIDHPTTGSESVGTFSQRYWYSTEFAAGPDSPVLLSICGEAECSEFEVKFLADVAKSLHASVVALEHRYYGKSLPYEKLVLENMKYLTIHNALEDLASFEAFAKTQLPLAGKWIAVGGSYAGMLAAFYRQKHPELVVGAWASSAPVNVQKSFWGYDALVSRALGPTCLLLTQQVMSAAGRAYDDPAQRKQLSLELFGAEWDPTWGGRDDFMGAVVGPTMSAAQYGGQARLCQSLVQHSDDPLAGMVAFVNPPIVPDDAPPATPVPTTPPAQPRTEEETASAMNFGPGFAPRFRRSAADATGEFSESQWDYQVCTEVGFYQVANPDRTLSVMPSSNDEAGYDKHCDELAHARPDVAKTRAQYYDPIVAGQISNVFWVNGGLDPWSALGFTDPQRVPGEGSAVFVVQLGSHCSELTNLKQNTAIPVFEAHVKFNELAKRWLAQ